MKRTLFFLIIFLILVSPVLGQELSVTPVPRGNKTVTMTPKITEEVKDKTLPNVIEKRNQRIRNFYQRLKIRLQAAVKRLQKLTIRISSRLDKLTQQGTDTSALKLKLTETQTKLDSIDDEIKTSDMQMEQLFTSTDPKTSFSQVKETLTQIKEDLKTVHQELVVIITEIKATLPKTTISPE